MDAEQTLTTAFDAYGLPSGAQGWLIDIWRVFQAFDDAADGDKVEAPERLVFSSLIGVQVNPFFVEHASILRPILAVQILKWQAANAVEKVGNADARSYTWRAGYYDLVLAVALIVHGPDDAGDMAQYVLGLYGETLPEYLAEFHNAG